MKGYVFIKNALVLTATSLILRTVGIVFRVYLADRIGAEGIGLYQLIFSVYVLASTFATSGISTAVTRLVADHADDGRGAVRRIMRRAILCTLAAAAVSMAVVFFGAEFIAAVLLGDIRAVPAIRILVFSLPFMGVSSCFRGYFLAQRRALPPSLAQLFEQAVRIAVVVFLLGRFAPQGIGAAAAAVLAGDTVAEAASMCAIVIPYLRSRRALPPGGGKIKGTVRNILKIALPISGSRYLTTGLHTAENLLVPGGIARYCGSKEQALSFFGKLKGMAIPILFFPASFLTAMSTLLIPEISSAAAHANGLRIKNAVNRAFSITICTACLISSVFIVSAGRIAVLIYGDASVGYIIRVLAPIVPLMYLESVADGMLKGLGQQLNSLWYNVIDMSIRIVLVLTLVPRFGERGFLLIMLCSNVLTSTLNCRRLLKVSGVEVDVKNWILAPVLSAVAAAMIGSRVATLCGEGTVPLIAVTGAQAAVYLAGMAVSGILRPAKIRAAARA